MGMKKVGETGIARRNTNWKAPRPGGHDTVQVTTQPPAFPGVAQDWASCQKASHVRGFNPL